jgi:uncharacterized protein (DUF488 family)
MASTGEPVEKAESISVLTIGHSIHAYERFLALLRGAGVTAIADVRTSPFSRQFPQFNRDTLLRELRQDGISYACLGRELGGRPNDSRLYTGGIADYEKMAATDEFRSGLDRVLEGAQRYRIALMCSEQDPLDCHRCLLVGRALAKRGVSVQHVLADGETATQTEIERRLLEMSGRNALDLFADSTELLAIAYRERARKVAFAEAPVETKGATAAE